MGSTRRLVGKVTNNERRAKIIGRIARFGRQVRLGQLSRVPKNPKEKKLLEKHLAEIQESRTTKQSSEKLNLFLAKTRVLKASGILRMQLNGINPTVFQILAVTALRFGLNSEQLKHEISVMANMWRTERRNVFWEGSPLVLSQVVKNKVSRTGKNFISSIEDLLFKKASFDPETDKFFGRAINSKSIADKLGLAWDPKNKKLINISLQFLASSGFVKKQPHSIIRGLGDVSVWSHRAYGNPRINYANPAIHIMSRLSTGGKTATELYKQKLTRGKYSTGNPFARFSYGAVMSNLKKMETARLVSIRTTKVARLSGHKGGPSTKFVVSLTPFGKKMWSNYQHSRELPEGLRKLLVGEKENNKKKKKK